MNAHFEISHFASGMRETAKRINQLNEIMARPDGSGILTTSSFDLQDGLVSYQVGAEVLRPYLEDELKRQQARLVIQERKAAQILEIINS